MKSPRTQTDTAAIDQRVGRVSRVIDNRPVDRGQAQFIAIILHPSHDPCPDPRGVERPGGDRLPRGIAVPKTQHVGHGNRAVRYTEHIPHHAAHARIRPAKRLDGGGMVVRLHFEREIILVVELDHPGIIHKRRTHPGRGDFARRFLQIGLDDGIDRFFADG